MAASECVHQHLESLIQNMTTDLENSDRSKHFLRQYWTCIAKESENARLPELLEEEAQARRTAEAAQMDGWCRSYVEQGATNDGGWTGELLMPEVLRYTYHLVDL